MAAVVLIVEGQGPKPVVPRFGCPARGQSGPHGLLAPRKRTVEPNRSNSYHLTAL